MAKNNFPKRKNESNKSFSKLILFLIILFFLFVGFCLFLNFYKSNFFSRKYALNNYIKTLVSDDENVYIKASVINYEKKDKEYLNKIINKN